MKTKYDWSGVPDGVKWIATDADGVVNGFYRKPVAVRGEKMWFENNECTGDFVQIDVGIRSGILWEDSLEERPQ